MESGPQKNHVLGSAVCAVASGQFALPDERQKSHLISLSVTIELILRRCLWGKPNYREELCCQNLSAKARVGRNQIALETCVKPELRRVRNGDNPQKSITTSSHLCNSSSSLHNNFSAIDFVVLQLGIYIPVGLVFLGDARWQKNDFFTIRE